MPTRPAIPRDIQRKLWALSMGHCFNSDCAQDLFAEGTSIGEIAHILPHSESGDASLNNLLLLCPTCHTMIDKNRPDWPISVLKTWHLQRQKEIRRRFTKQCDSFRELEKLVRPILQQNAAIFKNYGPTEDNSSVTARRSLWLKFEPKLIVNNQQLLTLFKANMRLIHMENRRTIEEFVLHVDEFVATRNTDDRAVRQHGRSGQSWTVDYQTRTDDRTSLIFLLSTGSRGAARRIAEHVLAGFVDLSHLKVSQSHLAFVSLFDDTEDVWREEDFGLVEQQSQVARWSRPDEFERILLAA